MPPKVSVEERRDTHLINTVCLFICLPLSKIASLICSGDYGLAEVLAKNTQPQGSYVSEWTGRNSGCHWAFWVCEGDGTSLQAAGQMCLQSTLPGRFKTQEGGNHFMFHSPAAFASILVHKTGSTAKQKLIKCIFLIRMYLTMVQRKRLLGDSWMNL